MNRAGTSPEPPTPTALIAIAFAVNWLAWGSTFLAGRIAVETLPPLAIVAVRSLIAGLLLAPWAFLLRARAGAPRAPRPPWPLAILTGILMFVGGQGGLTAGLLTVPSGVAALIQSTIPMSIVLFAWLFDRHERPTGRELSGLGLGLLGMVVLIGPWDFSGHTVDPIGAALVVIASLSWSLGSVISRRTVLVRTPMRTTTMQLLGGGGAALVGSLVLGDAARVGAEDLSGRSLGALGYLIVVGSLIGLGAYSFLLGRTTPARAASYAYVTPILAVFLGTTLAGEVLSPRIVLATAITIAGVALVIAPKRRRRDLEPGLPQEAST